MSDNPELESNAEDEEYWRNLQRLCDQAVVESTTRKKDDSVWNQKVKNRLETFRLELVVGACLAFGMMIFLLLSK
ncbi:MAG: hypothetical protein GXX80_13995 [Thermotogaceae bacterium]|nr:hypothetical protein [Thermotogaceae bacterium]